MHINVRLAAKEVLELYDDEEGKQQVHRAEDDKRFCRAQERLDAAVQAAFFGQRLGVARGKAQPGDRIHGLTVQPSKGVGKHHHVEQAEHVFRQPVQIEQFEEVLQAVGKHGIRGSQQPAQNQHHRQGQQQTAHHWQAVAQGFAPGAFAFTFAFLCFWAQAQPNRSARRCCHHRKRGEHVIKQAEAHPTTSAEGHCQQPQPSQRSSRIDKAREALIAKQGQAGHHEHQAHQHVRELCRAHALRGGEEKRARQHQQNENQEREAYRLLPE